MSVDVLNPANFYTGSTGYTKPTDYGLGGGGGMGGGAANQLPESIKQLLRELEQLIMQMIQAQAQAQGQDDDDDGISGVDPAGGSSGTPGYDPSIDQTQGADSTGGDDGDPLDVGSADGDDAPTVDPAAGNPAAGDPGQPDGVASPAPTSDPGSTGGVPTTSAGSGPNTIQITNSQDHAITVGKFKNGESTTDPSAEITLQPGQTGTIAYQNGEAGYVAQADSSGKFQSTASRLEYEADADGKMKYPDISYIDGRNASISLTDGAGLNKGDNKSIAGSAPADLVSTDAGGGKTIAGWYDGSTGQMQQGGAYMVSKLGTDGAYLHPNDDQLGAGANPMSATQSNVLYATFGNA